MTSETFQGKNSQSLCYYLNSNNLGIDIVPNKKGGLFGVLENGTQVTISKPLQEEMLANGKADFEAYNICEMPGKDQATGLPNGTTFLLITKSNRANVFASYKQ